MGCSLSTTDISEEAQAERLIGIEFELLATSSRLSWVTGTGNLLRFGLNSTTGVLLALPCAADTTGAKAVNAAGVPVDITLSYPSGRCDGASGLIRYAVTGSARIQHLGDPYAFRVTYTNLEVEATSATTRTLSRVSGRVEVRATSDSTLRVERNLVEFNAFASGGATTTRYLDFATVLVDPNGVVPRGGQVLTPRRITYDGPFSVVVVGASTDSARIALTTLAPFVPNNNCNGGFSAGQVLGIASGTVNGSANVTYSC
jgi:hypothetical protein